MKECWWALPPQVPPFKGGRDTNSSLVTAFQWWGVILVIDGDRSMVIPKPVDAATPWPHEAVTQPQYYIPSASGWNRKQHQTHTSYRKCPEKSANRKKEKNIEVKVYHFVTHLRFTLMSFYTAP